MIAIFIMIMIFAIFIVPIYYGIYEIRRDLIILKELPLLRRAGMCETASIIIESI
ncbi:hypothetical protein LCGC14_1082490 [marine sediment metagenome]|uniref:Uncharacterized protein n=1 Tax=marine sediment metagenome TaxID=412755 RepID=A0A0F9MEX5_9ZZZZ